MNDSINSVDSLAIQLSSLTEQQIQISKDSTNLADNQFAANIDEQIIAIYQQMQEK